MRTITVPLQRRVIKLVEQLHEVNCARPLKPRGLYTRDLLQRAEHVLRDVLATVEEP